MTRFFKPVLKEQDFLLTLAVDRYNSQFKRKMKIEELDIKSIRPRVGFILGYELSTKIDTDFLRFRIYLNKGKLDFLSMYDNQVDQGLYASGTLEDEILVASGTVDNWYVEEGVYKFRPIQNQELLEEYLALENGEGAFLLENGETIILE